MTDDPLAAYPAMMTTDEVAEYLGVKSRTVYSWRQRKVGPPWVSMGDEQGSAVRYPREGLRAYIADRTVTPKREPTKAVS